MQPRKLDVRATVYIDVFNCARCSGDHAHFKFNEFKRPIVDKDGTIWDFWGICPTTNKPVLMHSEKIGDDYHSEMER